MPIPSKLPSLDACSQETQNRIVKWYQERRKTDKISTSCANRNIQVKNPPPKPPRLQPLYTMAGVPTQFRDETDKQESISLLGLPRTPDELDYAKLEFPPGKLTRSLSTIV